MQNCEIYFFPPSLACAFPPLHTPSPANEAAKQMDDDLPRKSKRISKGGVGIEFPSSLWLTDSQIVLFLLINLICRVNKNIFRRLRAAKDVFWKGSRISRKSLSRDALCKVGRLMTWSDYCRTSAILNIVISITSGDLFLQRICASTSTFINKKTLIFASINTNLRLSLENPSERMHCWFVL